MSNIISNYIIYNILEELPFSPPNDVLEIPPTPNYTIKLSHRKILFEWLKDITQECEYSNRTLFLSLYIIDKYMNQINPSIKQLQLYGSACYYISSLINDSFYIPKTDLVYLSENNFTKEELKNMTYKILSFANYNFNIKTPFDFLPPNSPKETIDKLYDVYTSDKPFNYNSKRLAKIVSASGNDRMKL